MVIIMAFSRFGDLIQFRNRCLCLLLSLQGQSVSWLKEHFQVSRQTIYYKLDTWQGQSLRGLYNQPGQGRKTILTLADEPLVIQPVAAHAPQLKLARQAIQTELNRHFSQKTLERF